MICGRGDVCWLGLKIDEWGDGVRLGFGGFDVLGLASGGRFVISLLVSDILLCLSIAGVGFSTFFDWITFSAWYERFLLSISVSKFCKELP